MADGQRSIFTPVSAADLEGPFTDVLTQHPQQQAAQQMGPNHPGQGKASTVARLGEKFLAGMSEGRLRAFQQAENARLSKLNRLNSYVQQIEADPNISPDAKRIVRQEYFKVLGPMMAGADQKGKGGKKGEAGGDEKQTLLHKVAGMAKEIGLGMAGGKLPKGTPDVGAAYDSIRQLVFDDKGGVKPEFDIQKQVLSEQTKLEGNLGKFKPGESWWHDVAPVVGPHIERLRTLDPNRANATLLDLQERFPKVPPMLGAAMVMDKQRAAQAPPATGQPIPLGGTAGLVGPMSLPPGEPVSQIRQNGSYANAYAERALGIERVPVSLSDPNNPKKQIGAMYNPATKQFEHRVTGIPLPPEQQEWLEEKTPYHPPAAAQHRKLIGKPVLRNGAAYDRYETPDGTIEYERHVYDDRWRKRFNVQDLRDSKRAKQRVLIEYPKQKRLLENSWDQRLASLQKDPVLSTNPKRQKELAAEYATKREAELEDLENMKQEAITQIEELESSGKPAGEKKEKPASTVKLSKEAESIF